MKAISPKLMQSLEKEFIDKHDFPTLILMEQAALQVAKHCLLYSKAGDKAAILAGCGNNGGDAYALARILYSYGINCDIYALDYPKTHDAIENRRLFESIYTSKIFSLDEFEDKDYAIIADGLFGTGFRGGVDDELKEVFERINNSGSYRIAIDIPSGLNGNTGYVESFAIKANETICFHKLKQGLLLSSAPEYTGKIYVENIGIEDRYDEGIIVADEEYFKDMIKPLSKIAYKNMLGSLLVVAGSTNYAGAALMNCKAAINTGIGLITLASNEHTIAVLQASEMLPMGRVIESEEQKQNLLKELSDYDCISIGSGLENNVKNKKLVFDIIDIAKKHNIYCVIDAQALNFIANNDNIVLGANFIITPHPGEAARLLKCTTKDILRDYKAACEALYKKFSANIILKGARSLIYDGQQFAINKSGSPALAKGGSGDCLCGILAALTANKSMEESVFNKAALACFILGRAGELAEKKYGEYSSNGIRTINLISASVADELLM